MADGHSQTWHNRMSPHWPDPRGGISPDPEADQNGLIAAVWKSLVVAAIVGLELLEQHRGVAMPGIRVRPQQCENDDGDWFNIMAATPATKEAQLAS